MPSVIGAGRKVLRAIETLIMMLLMIFDEILNQACTSIAASNYLLSVLKPSLSIIRFSIS